MNWQVKYALENINNHFKRTGSAEHVADDAIRISIHDRPDTLVIISASYEITLEIAKQYHEKFPDLDFLCGYRKECVWTGEAINYLSNAKVGWGNAVPYILPFQTIMLILLLTKIIFSHIGL